MRVLPKALEQTIQSLSVLPGVGPRSAERYAYFLLKNNFDKTQRLSEVLSKLHNSIDQCPITFALIDKGDKVSPLYSDNSRDKTTIAIVAEPFDIVALENTNQYKGTYHVLGGVISPIDGIGPEKLNIKQLIKRVETDKVKEIILALNASVEGETTALYIAKLLRNMDLKLTRLARGLPMGLELEYADHITLGRALEGRQLV